MELAVGMKGAGGKTQTKIIECFPKNLLPVLIEANELFKLDNINIPQIVDAQNSIVEKIKKLKAEKEIR